MLINYTQILKKDKQQDSTYTKGNYIHYQVINYNQKEKTIYQQLAEQVYIKVARIWRNSKRSLPTESN